ncbi:MAG: hypothetical protein JNL83_26550 [Myxococcales bacterium]|nr:hypothetical protein [Myxococcales bacterium]
MLRALPVLLLVAGSPGWSCGGDGDDADGDGDGGDFPGVWQYHEGAFSFVNCYTTSTTVPLARSGFQLVEQGGALIRINPDGCRFTITPTTARHASGVTGEQCMVQSTNPYGQPITTRYTVKTLLLELRPDDASEMIEVFGVDSEQTSTLGTVNCEITGNNALYRTP